jgi:DNA polymerase III delta subunit
MSNYKNQKKESAPETQNPKILDGLIKSGKIGGLFCLFGEEEYMIDHYIARILSECSAGDDFDRAIFDADNFDADRFRDMISGYPMTSEYKIIIVKNAGDIKSSGIITGILAEYAGEIAGYCCVVFKMKSLGEPKAKNKTPAASAKKTKTTPTVSLAAYLKENAALFEFYANPPASLIKWQKKIAASANSELPDDVAAYILERGEKFMYPLKNSLDKLIHFTQREQRKLITKEDVDLLIPKKTEIEAFELSNALLEKKYAQALESLEKLKAAKEEPAVILGQIARHFGDLLPVHLSLAAGITEPSAISKQTGLHEYKVKLIKTSSQNTKTPPNS